MNNKYVVEIERMFSENAKIEDLLKQMLLKKYKKDITIKQSLCYNNICNTTVVDSK